MTEQFANPPITEALLDIRVGLPPEINLEKLLSFHEQIKEQFPERQTRFSSQTKFELKPDSIPQVVGPSGGPDGYLFRSPTENKVVQARLDGFTFNKFKPYKSWDIFSSEAKKLWQHYIEITRPKRITRLAIRYINRIEIPLPIKELKDYILTAPEIAPGMPNAMVNFFIQLIVPDPESRAVAVITENMEQPANGSTILPLILDIDVYENVSLTPDDKEIWSKMENLRKYKNTIFIKSVTGKTKELFK